MDNSVRDRSIESLLRRREGEAPRLTDQCVDAESLAAWMEGALPSEARATVEKHAAGCVRCQALLAAMARTELDVEGRPWWRSLTARWLVPAAALATALVVWISVGREPFPRQAPVPPAMTTPLSTNRPEPAAVAPPATPVLPPSASPDVFADKPSRQRAQAANADAPARHELDKIEPLRQDDKLAAAEQPRLFRAPAPVAGGVAGGIAEPRPQGQAAADAAARSAPAASAPVPASPAATPGSPVAGVQAPPPPATQSANATPSAAKPPEAARLAETVTISREAPKELAAGRGGGIGGVNRLEIRSSDPTYRWRILPPTGIQRSTDGGTTWLVVDPLPEATRASGRIPGGLTAGSSPARDVCWIVGREGIVLLSTNGATWQRRPFPESVDLTEVRAASATNALVTTADGRQFVTIDGGATWSVVK